uniref:[2Fe-2S]-binding domain-containing protein n=1 Tax=Ornithorhynchus anatinus TaxID=9258 RepID=A0A6I8NZR2_ORNAN
QRSEVTCLRSHSRQVVDLGPCSIHYVMLQRTCVLLLLHSLKCLIQCLALTFKQWQQTPLSLASSHFTVNACLAPICSLHHIAVTTVEGIGSTKTKIHPVQERISKSHGSQCGFCTPGIVMSMYTLLRNNPKPSMEEIENAFQGNWALGLRQPLDTWREFSGVRNNRQLLTKDEKTLTPPIPLLWQVTLSPSLFNPGEFLPLDPTQEPIFPPELVPVETPSQPPQLRFQGERVTWIQAATLEELLDLKSQHPDAVLVVGNTRVGIEMKFGNKVFPIIICPAWIPELNAVEHGTEGERDPHTVPRETPQFGQVP